MLHYATGFNANATTPHENVESFQVSAHDLGMLDLMMI